MQGLPLVAASGGHSSSRCTGLSLSWPLLLRSTGSRRAGSVVVAHGLSCSAARGIFPDQGSNPCALHWQADSQPLRHQGSPWLPLLFKVTSALSCWSLILILVPFASCYHYTQSSCIFIMSTFSKWPKFILKEYRFFYKIWSMNFSYWRNCAVFFSWQSTASGHEK